MKKLNNKGFTLVEVLAVVVILTVIGLIAIPNVIDAINTSKDASYDILVKDIVVASKQLYEELEFVGNSDLYMYNTSGKDTDQIQIGNMNSDIVVNLQTLVSNGFLTGNNNPEKTIEGNNNDKIITNPKTKEDIGECTIKIIKDASLEYKIEFVDNTSLDNDFESKNCPTTDEYYKAS